MTKLQSLLTELKREAIALNSPPPVDYRDFHSTFQAERNYNASLRNASPVLIEACIRMMDALKRECCCPGELNYDGKSILCDPCETLNALDVICERGMK